MVCEWLSLKLVEGSMVGEKEMEGKERSLRLSK